MLPTVTRDRSPRSPRKRFLQRVDRFRDWVAERPEPRVAVIGHGTFFRALTGRAFANAEHFVWDGWSL
jgi:broad specificity phosphatase PhoE